MADENELEALACRVGTISGGTETYRRTDRGTRPRASVSTESGHGAARNNIRTATFLSFLSRFPDARRCFLLPLARMADFAAMGTSTHGFGRPHVVRLSLAQCRNLLRTTLDSTGSSEVNRAPCCRPSLSFDCPRD